MSLGPEREKSCCGPGDSLFHSNPVNWFFWAFLAAFFAGCTAVLAKMGVQDVNSHLATAIRTSVVLVFSWILAAALVPMNQLSAINARGWVFLGLSGIATGLSWICYFRAMQLGEVSRVAAVDKLGVVFAVLLAIVILRERLSLVQGIGMVLIVAGVIAMSWKPAGG